ncbi:3-oxoacyl-[acyl-carrier protein] reductase [Bacillus pakistanensis]|uniref:3-oxoacyl-[acyl-carrier protein] reductase n=1 Tax=Rossellomorea pakistanensis TaxID=992288 RepID=A0ABS2N9D6_9BACI|nr:glucose 1-dehydrogenase [Bacillus pakistanensis]MBM7584477.1 3-oxoacyl-[acyl-carrier protein] reductase [Bacillus pakistanensis]
MRLHHKSIVVTGAGGGMGLAVVKLLLDKGANVIATDLNTQMLNDFESEQLAVFEGDMLDETFVEKVFAEGNAKFGSISGLVNAAGIAQKAKPIEDVSLAEWTRILNVNTTLLFLTCKEAAKYMKKQGYGSIINVASISAVRPRPGLQAYITSKGGAESLTRALAIELADHHIRVNTIHPGPCDTNMLEQFAADGANIDEVKNTIFKQSVPLGNLLKPADIAYSIAFLLSDEAHMITGATLNVDGGRGI